MIYKNIPSTGRNIPGMCGIEFKVALFQKNIPKYPKLI
jgi:hypothetical protein